MIPAVEIAGLRKRYRRVEALAGIDLVVPAGSVFGFLGPNGAGKTTTMKILMGLIRPNEGAAHVLGRDVRDGVAVRARIGYLPQDPSFYASMRVHRVLRFVAKRFLSGSRAEIDRKVDETLALVGLGDRADRRVKALSGGELRRLGIAQAYIGRPDLLILDEPSVGLDPAGRREVIDLLDSLRGETTVFYSTHILDDVQRIADHIAVLDRGRILAQGPIGGFRSGAEASYEIALTGDGGGAVEAFAAESWVSSVAPVGDGRWRVTAASRAEAEAHLAPRLVAAGAPVSEIRPLQKSLEDIYLEITEAAAGEEATDDD